MSRRGTMVEDGEHATITFVREYRHAIEHVWDAIATPDGLRGWLLATEARIDGRTGGTIELVSGPASYRSTGRILAWEPPRLLEYEWNVEPVPEMPRGEHAVFRFELASRGDVTELVVIYRRITRATVGGFLPGTHAFLDRLEAQLDGAPLPDWFVRFAVRSVEYPEWEDHAASSGQ